MALGSGELARLSALLDELLDQPAGQRAAWLDALAPADDALRPQLARMLADLETGNTALGLDGLLDQMPLVAEAAAEDRLANAAPAAGAAMKQIGPYRLLRPLGRGGMGTVWLAERIDGAFSRTVALKLPHMSLLEPGLARRFERERDILAALEHPHIARLYDAGVTEDGQPYLALEHVDGVPITTHCDQAGLGLRQRIGLFIQVLQAVQFAHARLVVHRDLKPSNIFVTPEGQVRLLDFGIATLLDDSEQPRDQAPTEWSHAPMTPDYASPEQIAHQPIGTASDVYSLGVVFYELVTGQRPYRLARDSRGALEEAILGTDPTKPSRMPTTEGAAALRGAHLSGLRRQLRGDLDNISLKALRKDPAERYPSAEAFEQDLVRWIRNEPVLAHPSRATYRAAKFIRRNRWQVGAVGGVALALIAGTGVALHQATVAQREAARAQAVQQFLVGLFNEADPARAQGRELTVRDLMARGGARPRGHARQHAGVERQADRGAGPHLPEAGRGQACTAIGRALGGPGHEDSGARQPGPGRRAPVAGFCSDNSWPASGLAGHDGTGPTGDRTAGPRATRDVAAVAQRHCRQPDGHGSSRRGQGVARIHAARPGQALG